MSDREYERIRTAYDAWMAGEARIEGALRESFEKQRSPLEALGLDDLEAFDPSTESL